MSDMENANLDRDEHYVTTRSKSYIAWIKDSISGYAVIVGGLTGFVVIALIRVFGAFFGSGLASSQDISNAPVDVVQEIRMASTSANLIPTELESSAYRSSQLGFQIHAPKRWTATPDSFGVIFEDPDHAQAAFEGVSVTPTMDTAQECAAAYTTKEDVYGKGKITSQGTVSLDGREAYAIEYTSAYGPNLNGEMVPIHAISICTVRSGLGYAILGVADERIWSKYRDVIVKSASTFRFNINWDRPTF